MPTKKKEIIFTPFSQKQLLAAKRNSIIKRGNSKADTKKYFKKVMKDIRNLATGKNTGVLSPHSDFFPKAKAGQHNIMLFEVEKTIYIVGFIHPEQDSRALLIDQEELLRRLGVQKFAARLKKISKSN